MGSESIAHEAKGRMGYWLRTRLCCKRFSFKFFTFPWFSFSLRDCWSSPMRDGTFLFRFIRVVASLFETSSSFLWSTFTGSWASWNYFSSIVACQGFWSMVFNIKDFSTLVPSRPRRFRMWRHLSSLSGKFAYRARFQASSGHSDSANRPGYEAGTFRLLSMNANNRVSRCHL